MLTLRKSYNFRTRYEKNIVECLKKYIFELKFSGKRTTVITCEDKKYHYQCYTCKVNKDIDRDLVFQILILEVWPQFEWKGGLSG